MAEPSVPGLREAIITPPAVEASIEDGQRLFEGDLDRDFEDFMATNPHAALAATMLINMVGELVRVAVEDGVVENDPHDIARYSSKATVLFFARALHKMRAQELEDSFSA